MERLPLTPPVHHHMALYIFKRRGRGVTFMTAGLVPPPTRGQRLEPYRNLLFRGKVWDLGVWIMLPGYSPALSTWWAQSNVWVKVALDWAQGLFLHVPTALLPSVVPTCLAVGGGPAVTGLSSIWHSGGFTSSQLSCSGLEHGCVAPEILVSSFAKKETRRSPPLGSCWQCKIFPECLARCPTRANEGRAWFLTLLTTLWADCAPPLLS